MKHLPGLNVQYPYSELILTNKKTIETRTYPLPEAYRNVDIYLIETPGKKETFKAHIKGIVRFSDSFLYKSKKQFYSDLSKHLVDEHSVFAWKDQPKYGWIISHARSIEPIPAPTKRGIIFTKQIEI